MIEVNVGECQCAGAPHSDGDWVGLREKLGLAPGIAVQTLLVRAKQEDAPLSSADLHGALAEAYLIHGVEAWSFVQDDGRPLPVNPMNIQAQLLGDFARAAPVADKADDLYGEAVILPLLKKAATSSPNGSTKGSTSVTRIGSRKPRKRSKPSSTTTSATGVTTTISA